MKPKKALTLSIIIPAYNEEGYLGACLESVAAQTMPPDEVIVVNNNSTDATAAIVMRFPFAKLLQEKQIGVLYARNRGFNSANSDIIARIDADTRLSKNWVSTVKAAFSKFPRDALTGPVGFYDMPLPASNHKLDEFFRSRIYRHYNRLPFLFGTNMAFLRSDWKRVSALTCTRRDMFEDIDLAIHLNRLGVNCRYYPPMLASMSARRCDDGLSRFNSYLKLFDKTYQQHGYKSLMPKVARSIYLSFYVLMWLPHRLYDEKAGRRTIGKLFRHTPRRKHPMDAS